MRDADGTIERLLAGLRDAEPPAGIERRILEALDGMEGHEASAFAAFWRRAFRPAMAMLLACTVILIAGIAAHQQRHAPATLSRSTGTDVRPAARPELVTQKVSTAPRRTTLRVSVKHPHDAPAVAETQAASFPAPPLPLTEQERLLLRRCGQHGHSQSRCTGGADRQGHGRVSAVFCHQRHRDEEPK